MRPPSPPTPAITSPALGPHVSNPALHPQFHGANESNDSFFNALSAKRTPSQAM